MAKIDSQDSDPTVEELKQRLRILTGSIAEEEDYRVETVDSAREALLALKLKKTKGFDRPSGSLFDREKEAALFCPEAFKCPLSNELMRDPVVLSSGQTCDRAFIQKWLRDGNRICPVTNQILSSNVLTPNTLVREMIAQWCATHAVAFHQTDDAVSATDRNRVLSLLDKLSSLSLSDQKLAAKELRSLTKKSPELRAMIGESPGAVAQLLKPLSGGNSGRHAGLQEDIITTVLNLSIHDGNKKLVGETPSVVPILMEGLKSGTVETRANAAAALFTLSALDTNKTVIGKSGALKLLLNLLEEGHPLVIKDAASSIFSLCIVHENKAIAVKDGAVAVILRKIMDSVFVDELLSILAVLSSHHRAVEELAALDAAPCLLRVTRESGCGRNKENCIAILYTMCFNDRKMWKLMKEEENLYGTISKLAEEGTPRAKRKAVGILERLNRASNLTHTA